MAIKFDVGATTTPSTRPLWVAMVALVILAVSTAGRNEKDPVPAPSFDDTPNGLSGHLHKAMENVLAIQKQATDHAVLTMDLAKAYYEQKVRLINAVPPFLVVHNCLHHSTVSMTPVAASRR